MITKEDIFEMLDDIFEAKFKKKVIRGGKMLKKTKTYTAGKRIDTTGKGVTKWTGTQAKKKSIEQIKAKRKKPVKKKSLLKRAKSMKKRERMGLNK